MQPQKPSVPGLSIVLFVCRLLLMLVILLCFGTCLALYLLVPQGGGLDTISDWLTILKLLRGSFVWLLLAGVVYVFTSRKLRACMQPQA